MRIPRLPVGDSVPIGGDPQYHFIWTVDNSLSDWTNHERSFSNLVRHYKFIKDTRDVSWGDQDPLFEYYSAFPREDLLKVMPRVSSFGEISWVTSFLLDAR